MTTSYLEGRRVVGLAEAKEVLQKTLDLVPGHIRVLDEEELTLETPRTGT
jgi:hypothetical protein